ncbi:hypothetical protein F4803DRAFT_225413 [Xylaria telfairii]|nr:hypothetical protein F4803DRAFT_225413 [Xylaria telfairii]
MTDNSKFTCKSHGINSQGNYYCARDYGANVPNHDAYCCSNNDRSYFYNNPDDGRYHNDGTTTRHTRRPTVSDTSLPPALPGYASRNDEGRLVAQGLMNCWFFFFLAIDWPMNYYFPSWTVLNDSKE